MMIATALWYRNSRYLLSILGLFKEENMQENTNRAIAYNSVILYGKMVINTICALLTTRFALQALGVTDYGLYSLLGSIISFISIFNTIMVSTSNRFIAVAIGKGDRGQANRQFNIIFVIHLAIAIGVLLLAYPLGEWYIPKYVNYEGPLSNAMMVYAVSIAGSILSFVGVPYNGLLMAKEKFIVFSLVDVISHVVRLAVAWILVYHFENKLLIYTLWMALMTAMPTLVYIIFCSCHYPDVVKLHPVHDGKMYRDVFNFSAWVGVGALAQVGKNQGAALVVNLFFNTAMNTAMGVASSINYYVSLFAQNVTQPMAPQITKSYAAGNQQRTDELLVMSTKFSFMLTFLIGSIFLIEPDWLLGLWLGEVPAYAPVFLVLLVTDSLVQSLNSGVANIIFASGRLALFQSVVSVLNISAVVLGYFILKGGAPAYYLVVAYICVSLVKFFAIQIVLRVTLHYDNWKLWKKSYFPSLITVALYLPMLLIPDAVHPAVKIVFATIYLCVIDLFVCFHKEERKKLARFISAELFKKGFNG